MLSKMRRKAMEDVAREKAEVVAMRAALQLAAKQGADDAEDEEDTEEEVLEKEEAAADTADDADTDNDSAADSIAQTAGVRFERSRCFEGGTDFGLIFDAAPWFTTAQFTRGSELDKASRPCVA